MNQMSKDLLQRALGYEVKKCLYQGHCPLDDLCPEHLTKHQSVCGGSCEICSWQPKRT